ncbi:hypothetical protein L7F22_014135 [Adiantum nelumboides]|nr:hypothetical protein [Adiantum nelumboides]
MLSKTLTWEEREDFKQMLRKFPRLFAKDYTDVQGMDAIQHKIELKPEIKPKAQKLRRLGVIKEQALLKEVQKLLAAGFIYPVENFEWVSPVVVTPKKNGKWRVCVDYRPLNEATKRDHFSLPFQDEILNEVAGKEKYTICDGYSGYFQIGIELEDQLKTTFITPWGCFAFRVMPFGLTNAPVTFQCFMNMVFQEFFGKSIRVFIDDFCIYSSKAIHPQKVEEGLKKLYDMGGQLNPDKCHIGEDEVILLGHKVSYKGIEVDPSKAKALIDLPSPKSLKERLTQQVEFVWSKELEEYFCSIKVVLSELPTLMPSCWEFTFFVSSSVVKETLGAVLLQQDPHSTRMRPIYFASRVMNALEKNYTEAEFMMLSLVFAVRKFRSYLLPKPFIILTAENLFPWVSSQMTLSTRISKCIMELQKFQYSFKVEDSVRAQLTGILTYRVHERDIKVPEVKTLSLPPPKSLPNAFTLFFDGAFRKATGKAGGGLVLHDSNGEVVMKKHVKLPDSTSNNEAEYDILLHGLQVCVSQKIRRLMVKGDALLIVKQILGIWACKNEKLKEKVQAIRRLFNQFEEVQLYHIPRKQNEVADLLAQKVVACDESEVQVILATTAIKQPRYQGMESLAPIVSYILESEFPQSFTKAQKQRLMEKASSYLFLEGALYQRGKDQVCRRILTVEEIPSILEGLHEEAYGGHFAQELTAKNILLSGYVWPSLHIDVQHWCKSCHNCQVNGNKHLLHGPRQLVLANGPFEKWGIDAMAPLLRTKNGKLYILVAIDYMTRFGTPLEIVSDNGPGFRKGLLTEVCEELHILHWHSTPYYPQSNGLVEKANGIIAGIIRKMVKNKTKLWDDFLDGALWAYRTTYKEATEFTPFHLVYGQEALQPIELNIPTMRLHGKAAQRKEEEWTDRLLTLAELEWKREAAYECYKRKATQVKDKLDKEVKDKGIKEGDLVLRYDNRLDNRFDAMFETRWQGPYIVKKAFNSSYYQLMDLDGKEHPRKVNGYRLKPYLSRILPKDLQDQRQKSTLSHKSCSLVQVRHAIARFGVYWWWLLDMISSIFGL